MSRGYRCHECPDDVRDERGCRRPRRDGGVPVYHGDGCPVEQVPGWYWRLCDKARAASRGWWRPDSYAVMQEIEHLEAAQGHARAVEAEEARQRDEMRARARAAAGG